MDFLCLFLNNRGFGLYLLFNFSAIMAMHLGLFLWALKGANFSNSALLIIIGFSFCSVLTFIAAIYIVQPRLSFKSFYLERVHYFKEHVQENIRLLLALLILATVYTYYQMYVSGTFLGNFTVL